MDRHRREKGKNEKDRDRRRTGTSNNGRTKGNDYVKKRNAQGMAGDVIPCPFAVDKDYLETPAVTFRGIPDLAQPRLAATTRGSSV
jgi:hypothetical protein